MEIRRCAIVINKDRRQGQDYPVKVVNAKLYAILRRHKITSNFFPHIDDLSPLQRVDLAIFDCQRLVEGDDQDEYVIKFIRGQRKALEGLADQLKDKTGLSLRQQAFIDSITSAGGNDAYWAWFMELKCAIAEIESMV
ncbi:hypothetical protein IL306_014840 [Fusarium sp. DS 682]|nr:hypothetical protein IL306_014840 [Fusarium sp. DS 682]